MIAYKQKTATASQIEQHLTVSAAEFVPALHNTVNIKSYAQKIFDKAETFEAWEGDELVGIIACYFNDRQTSAGFITNVSIERQYQGKGIAKKLLDQCVAYGIAQQFTHIDLEVNKDNHRAIEFYKGKGFVFKMEQPDSYILTYSLLK